MLHTFKNNFLSKYKKQQISISIFQLDVIAIVKVCKRY